MTIGLGVGLRHIVRLGVRDRRDLMPGRDAGRAIGTLQTCPTHATMDTVMSAIDHLMTAGELFQTPGLGRCELVRGELIQMTPAGFEHGRIAVNIGWILKEYVRRRPIGTVTGAEDRFSDRP